MPYMLKAVYLIPAYQPSERLIDLVHHLRSLTPDPILVVNDGSNDDRAILFEKIGQLPHVTVLRHAINLGKGAALKTAFNYSLVHFPDATGSITLDADGQHRPQEAVQIGRLLTLKPGHLILGCREFDQKYKVPFRSRFGNQLTQKVFKFLTGVEISDTQTGLRGIPRSLMASMLRTSSSGYDFETDMLINAVQQGIKISEFSIPTIYIDGNASSHFDPLRDSIRIYFVFIRFAFASIATAIVDLAAFVLAHWATGNLLTASVSGRIVSGTFNFTVSKRLVFLSRGRVLPEVIRYITLVAFFLFLSNSGISVLVRRLGMNVYFAKVLVETSLFLLSFTVQRLIIFPTSASTIDGSATDWDAYYQKPFKTASVTRRITTQRILTCFRRYGNDLKDPVILELGGGNSCVYGEISESIRPKKYVIIDKNKKGLEKFNDTYPSAQAVELIEDDVLELKKIPQKADICFSIGLIEHFSVNDTKRAIRAHFECIGPDGLVLITFPTPTWLYRITRGAAEALNLWKFPDERPCTLDEVTSEIKNFAEILHSSIIWPIFLTQGLIVAKPLSLAIKENS